jgi:hypothetical protein
LRVIIGRRSDTIQIFSAWLVCWWIFVNKLISKGYLKPFQRQAKAYCDEFEDEKIPRALSQGRLDYPL